MGAVLPPFTTPTFDNSKQFLSKLATLTGSELQRRHECWSTRPTSESLKSV